MTSMLEELTQRYEYFGLSLHYTIDDLRPVIWHNYAKPAWAKFEIEIKYTALIKLTKYADFESYLMYVRTARRQEYRSCSKSNYSLVSSHDHSLLDQLHEKTFARQSKTRTNAEIRMATQVASSAVATGKGEIVYCLSPEGRIISGCLFIIDNHIAYYMVGSTDPEYRKTGAGTFLILEYIRLLFSRNIYVVDMIGVNSPNRGDYKLSFDAELVQYHEAKYTHRESWSDTQSL